MTAEEAAMLMMSGSGSVKPITITKNGHYEAPDGIDGYNPIDVNVPDRYDEGYKDGYKDGYNDAKNLNQKIIEQLNGDLPSVTDENGNTIENAIVSNDPDYINDIVKNTVFSNGGGSVTVQGLSGDAKATLKVFRIINEYGVNCGVGYDLIITNTLTGKTFRQNGETSLKSVDFSEATVVIDKITFADKMRDVSFNVRFYNRITGEYWGKGSIGAYANIVGAKKFGTPGDQTAITQTQG